MTKPFKIESADITRLNDTQLTQLLNDLLHSEAYKFGIVQRSVQVALNIHVADGGEDGRISWEGEPTQTDFLPRQLTMFQNKATSMSASAYANEVTTDGRRDIPQTIKPMVAQVLDEGGAYIVFTTQQLNTEQKEERINAVRRRLSEHNRDYADSCEIQIYDASQIALWVNQFIKTIVTVQHWIGTPVERGLKTFDLWSEHEDLSRLPFVNVDSRKDLLDTLLDEIAIPKSCMRIMGLSGLGKTRTAYQLFEQNKLLRNLVVYVDADLVPNIDGLVADWVGMDLRAIVIVDNCEHRLHSRLVREVRRHKSQISLLTLDYNVDSISAPTRCFKLRPMEDPEVNILLSPVYKDQLPDLDRIVAFAQGFPQMAVLLAEARLAEEPQIGELTDDELAHKMLWRRHENENADVLRILQACSLFDVFGIDKGVDNQLEFIANIVNVDINQVYACIQEYSNRGLIDRRGRFGQVKPKPLAIRLAGQWWTTTREAKQLELVESIPEEMIEGFCHQVEKMDFHTNVKQLTEQLCGPKGPFGQAEVILSVRGSRLFRAFVTVNPESTSKAIYKSLETLNLQQLLAIKGDTRRNLVWALERLCFHYAVFSESAWSMLLLATAENETWSNNATGMFSQLYRIQLSGTAAPPQARFALMKRALDLNRSEVDMVLLEALGQAISTHGNSRTIGAEYQGTQAPLEEWRPEIWQHIFDYWQQAFDLLLIMLERGELQKSKVLSDIGQSIRGFVARGRIEMLDSAVRHIVSINGPYWPAALDTIKITLEHDSDDLRQEAKDALTTWLDLLNPANAELSEKLKIIVINPPWEHKKGEDGHYIDIAAENAKHFATEMADDINELLPHLHLLLQGQQKQSHSFGHQLALELQDVGTFIEYCFDAFYGIENPNPSFLSGIYSGIFHRSTKEWQTLIDRLLNDKRLVYLYPSFIRTGTIHEGHLETLLNLIRNGSISSQSANALGYGSVTDSIAHNVLADFCLTLSQLDEQASWSALNIIYMYCFGKKGSIEKLREPLKHLVSTVSLRKAQERIETDFHQWQDLAEKLLKDHDPDFAISLTNQLISACQHGFNHGDIWNYFKPILRDIMRDYGNIIWPIFGDAVLQATGSERYWLQQLLERENRFSKKEPSILSVAPIDSLIAWCEQNPQLGPRFVAGSLNILECVDNKYRPTELFIIMLEKFGDDSQVADALGANMASRAWSGSLIPYLESDAEALRPLVNHGSENVRCWVRSQLDYIKRQIEFESIRDEERDIGFY